MGHSVITVTEMYLKIAGEAKPAVPSSFSMNSATGHFTIEPSSSTLCLSIVQELFLSQEIYSPMSRAPLCRGIV
jgi:hypothetical protein